MTYTVTDLFCGAGGSGLGATAVPGVELVMAANHSPRAIETHALNFPGCEHDCADISQVQPRRYRRTNILWASPECTNHSVAKGRKRSGGEPDLFGDVVPDHVMERSRATMWDVPRFAEVHRYDAVIVENVVDAAMWEPFAAWLMSMEALGYQHKAVFLNSMHAPAINAPRAPQSRDRMYIVFWRKGNRAPDLEIRPLAWCPHCGRAVRAVQVFKPRGKTWPLTRWGRYRAQYLYRCPTARCHADVEPYALPAAAAIDWDTPGERIGDREKPLSDKTLARIRAGLERYASAPFVTVHKGGPGEIRTAAITGALPTLCASGNHYGLACPPLLVPSGGTWNEAAQSVGEPFRARTCTENESLLVPVEGRDGLRAAPIGEPLRTQTARHETALVVPYYGTGRSRPTGEPMPTMCTVETAGLAFIAELRGGGSTTRPVRDPLATVCASGNHHMLVRHYSKPPGGEAHLCTPAAEPLRTLTTEGRPSLVGWPSVPPDVDDCTFRMLTIPEIQAAMAFTSDYIVTGSKREQVKQLGNGVTPPAAEWLVRVVVESLAPTREAA